MRRQFANFMRMIRIVGVNAVFVIRDNSFMYSFALVSHV